MSLFKEDDDDDDDNDDDNDDVTIPCLICLQIHTLLKIDLHMNGISRCEI